MSDAIITNKQNNQESLDQVFLGICSAGVGISLKAKILKYAFKSDLIRDLLTL